MPSPTRRLDAVAAHRRQRCGTVATRPLPFPLRPAPAERPMPLFSVVFIVYGKGAPDGAPPIAEDSLLPG